MSTQITIPFGETDTISFQLGGRNGAASASVTLDGVSQGTYSSSASTNIGGTGNVGPYKFNSFTTVGTGSVQTLAFNDSSGVPVLQEVAVSPVPEPTAAGLLLLAGVGLLARRKTRKAALDPLGAN